MKFPVVSACLMGVISYLGYHAVSGDQGLSSWSEMQNEIRALELQRSNLEGEREQLEQNINRLYADSLDDDFLEELARRKFHFVYADEIVLEPPELTSQQPENEDLFALSN
ncbi:septum formation initiator family protein [Ponticaulis sp.]|uniref:FtsB family cell division protein n=1 Tax=Ponticaulis sp. TaxID=2020902 RepID=UPI000B7258D3|nr:septum formation initiator family protein [Ponticaulis sp.]MAI89417.1 septum formation initiator [Ponticaulis sp.]OUY00455.1 MAG: hypothetical protein CBB65_03165 [Hyphomonadaceae bacterium TMED5]|tara:strand:- start:63116 stop:63448 length:333 start_codon:yes stop_codon:yes gene_type:complete